MRAQKVNGTYLGCSYRGGWFCLLRKGKIETSQINAQLYKLCIPDYQSLVVLTVFIDVLAVAVTTY